MFYAEYVCFVLTVCVCGVVYVMGLVYVVCVVSCVCVMCVCRTCRVCVPPCDYTFPTCAYEVEKIICCF